MATVMSWMEVGLWFMACFTPAALWGAFSYWALMRTDGQAEVWFSLLAVVLAFITTLPMIGVEMAVVPVSAMLCLVPAKLERQVNVRFEWPWYFGKLVLATYLSVMVGLAALTILDSFVNLHKAISGSLPAIAVFAGLALAPSAISVFRWVIHTSKLRPGLDV